jgi:hypothetical protein
MFNSIRTFVVRRIVADAGEDRWPNACRGSQS